MANLRLKKTILEVVDNQLKANDPPCTKDTYEKLIDAGYSNSAAKEKIGAVVLTEIYDILKEGQAFDEERFKAALQEMLRQSLDVKIQAETEKMMIKPSEKVQISQKVFKQKNSLIMIVHVYICLIIPKAFKLFGPDDSIKSTEYPRGKKVAGPKETIFPV